MRERCSLALGQAQLLAGALGTGWTTSVRWPEAATGRDVTPWYRAAVAQDRLGRTQPAGGDGGANGPVEEARDEQAREQAELARSLLRDGLFPALRTDPVVLRAFLRMMNLLAPPDALVTDGDVVTRVMQVYARRGERPPEPPVGPGREELLAPLTPSSTKRGAVRCAADFRRVSSGRGGRGSRPGSPRGRRGQDTSTGPAGRPPAWAALERPAPPGASPR